MLRHKPAYTYSGLTIVLSHASRFDKVRLLCATGGHLIDEFLQPEFNRHQCDIRLKDDIEPLLPETKCILLLGEQAAKLWLNNNDDSLNELRGSIFFYDGRFSAQNLHIPCVASYFPQDAADIKNYEAEANPQEASLIDDSSDDDDKVTEYDQKSRKNNTRWFNFRFWLQQDIKKAKRLVKSNGVVPKRDIEPEYVIAPSSNELIRLLTDTKRKDLFIDIETFVHDCSIKCIAFSFDKHAPIYVFPCISHDYSWAYSNLPHIYRALAHALRDNTVIAHNGCHFDFFVFAWKYKIAIGRSVKDTMIQMHRAFPFVEKSLGHCISLFTNEPFHKDEGECGYYTPAQVRQTLEYCAKDVFTTKLVYYAQLEYAKRIPGLQNSFDRGNACIRPYLTMCLQGMSFDDDLRRKTIKENDRLCEHYIKFSRFLIGVTNIKAIAGKSKSSILNSNKQLCTYFHDMLGYDVVGRGQEREDGSRGASLAKKNMFKLRMKYENPVIDLSLAYRELVRESGYLNFTPWELNPTPKLQQTTMSI